MFARSWWITFCHIINWAAFLRCKSTPSESFSSFFYYYKWNLESFQTLNGMVWDKERGNPKGERKISCGSTEVPFHHSDFLEQRPWNIIKSNKTCIKCYVAADTVPERFLLSCGQGEPGPDCDYTLRSLVKLTGKLVHPGHWLQF